VVCSRIVIGIFGGFCGIFGGFCGKFGGFCVICLFLRYFGVFSGGFACFFGILLVFGVGIIWILLRFCGVY